MARFGGFTRPAVLVQRVAAVLAAGAIAFIVVSLAFRDISGAATAAGIAGGVVALVAYIVQSNPKPPKLVPPPVGTPPDWMEPRPDKVTEVVKELERAVEQLRETNRADWKPVIGLTGLGGFGKTTLAKMVQADPRVTELFPGGVWWATVGQKATGADLAGLINGLIEPVDGRDPRFGAGSADLQRASQTLAGLLSSGKRRLLILDDVWQPEQLRAFCPGSGYAVLVTTRVSKMRDELARTVTVDAMTVEEARALLTRGNVQALDPEIADQLLAATGCWALLVHLIHQILTRRVKGGEELATAGPRLLEQLAAGGPAIADVLLNREGHLLDLADEEIRTQAVRATIDASVQFGGLSTLHTERLRDLAVLAPGKPVPQPVILRVWQASCGLDEQRAEGLCNALVESALLTVDSERGLKLHEVIRAFLLHEPRQPEHKSPAEVNTAFLRQLAEEAERSAGTRGLAPDTVQSRTRWWGLQDTSTSGRYLRDQLIWHLFEADRRAEAEDLATDLHWIGARIQRDGPTAAVADLDQAGTPRAARMARSIIVQERLLAATDPGRAVIDVLHSRMADDPDWKSQVAGQRLIGPRPRLVNRWPVPDASGPALLRQLESGDATVTAVGANGRLLAAGCADGTVRAWDTATWKPSPESVLCAGKYPVNALVFSPDGHWAATGDGRFVPYTEPPSTGTVKIWDAAVWPWKSQATVPAAETPVQALAFSPDGRRLAVGSAGKVCLWELCAQDREPSLNVRHLQTLIKAGEWSVLGRPSKPKMRAGFVQDDIRELSFTPDGKHVVFFAAERIFHWDTRDWELRSEAARDHPGRLKGILCFTPDGAIAATADERGTVRTWDVAARRQRAELRGHDTKVTAAAFGPDGSWLATAGGDQTIRIWDPTAQPPDSAAGDPASLQPTSKYGRRINQVVASPDGDWLIVLAPDEILLLDPETGKRIDRFEGPSHFLAVNRDASRLITGMGVWETELGIYGYADARSVNRATREVQAVTSGLVSDAVAVSPDGTLYATGHRDGSARTWNAVTGEAGTVCDVHVSAATQAVTVLTFSDDGKFLAAGGRDGTARMWDVSTGRPLHTFAAHQGKVAGVVFTRGGLLATAGDDTARTWDVGTGQPVHTFAGHHGLATAIAASPDGTLLATGGSDGALRVWDLSVGSMRPVAMMRVESPVTSCAWVGQRGLAAAGLHGLYLFDLLT